MAETECTATVVKNPENDNATEDLWENALAELRGKLELESFETWFGPVSLVAGTADLLTVSVPNKFHADWLRTHYLDLMVEVLRDLGAPALRIEVKIAAASAPRPLRARERVGGPSGAAPEPARKPKERVPAEPPSGTTLAPAQLTNVVVLPVWPNAMRACPNGMLRSAVFGVCARGARRYIELEPIAAMTGIEIFYTGPQLDQGDLDVWLAVLHLCRAKAMGERCYFTAYELLKLLGKDDTGGKYGSRKMLELRLSRLRMAGLRIQLGGRFYEGGLLHEFGRVDERGKYLAVINPKMRPLFDDDQFTQLEWAVRQALDGKPLAQWMHAFYSTHATPHPIKISTLRELCGSEIGRERAFKEKLKKALASVAAASKAHGQLFGFSFDGDLVCVERDPSGSQRRHLASKCPRSKAQ